MSTRWLLEGKEKKKQREKKKIIKQKYMVPYSKRKFSRKGTLTGDLVAA